LWIILYILTSIKKVSVRLLSLDRFIIKCQMNKKHSLWQTKIYLRMSYYGNFLISASRNAQSQPPAYTAAPNCSYYQAPPPAYAPPEDPYYSFVPYSTFPTAPPGEKFICHFTGILITLIFVGKSCFFIFFFIFILPLMLLGSHWPTGIFPILRSLVYVRHQGDQTHNHCVMRLHPHWCHHETRTI
jgi:hypothetical protein